MSDPSIEGSVSTPPTSHTQSTSTCTANNDTIGGFYDKYRAGNLESSSRPSFLKDSSPMMNGVLDSTCIKSDLQPASSISNLSATSLSTTSMSSLKRKRPTEVVSKPSFNVSEFIGTQPHLPKFGTSLTKMKLGFTSPNQSKFYSGWTKFGGSSSFREGSAKRMKISPVSAGARTNVTQITAKPYRKSENKRTLTSKTAESILKTLNKICTPIETPVQRKTDYSGYSSNFSSLSKRLREKRKAEISSLPPPISRLNQIRPAHVNMKIDDNTRSNVSCTVINADMSNIQAEKSQSVEIEKKTSEIETVTSESKIKVSESEKIVAVYEPVESVPAESVTVNITEEVLVSNSEVEIVQKTEDICDPEKDPVEILPMKSTVKDITKQPELSVVSKNSLKMKRQLTRDHYTAGEKTDEPVNTMPEVTAVQPLLITELPKFDLSVKPSSAPIFTPIMKPVSIKDATGNVDEKYKFSTPKTVADKDIDCPSFDAKYSFISPVTIMNPASTVAPKKVDDTLSDLGKLKDEDSVVKEITKAKSEILSTESSAAEVDDVKQPSITFGFKLPKKEAGSWDCPTCMITNKPDCLKCLACTEPKPGSSEKSISLAPAAVTTSEFSFGKPSVAPGKFAGFSFGNSYDVKNPMVSETEVSKSGSSPFSFGTPISSQTFGNIDTKTELVPSNSTEKTPAVESIPNPLLKLKPAEGSWDCPTCMVTNASDVLKCLACTEPKPGSKEEKSAISSSFKFGATAAPSSISFGGTTCNTSGFTFGAPAANANSSSFSFGKPSDKSNVPSLFEKLKPVEGSWACPVCMVTNKPDVLKCAACNEPKPGDSGAALSEAQPVSKPFSFGNSTSNTFSFGTSTKPPATESLSFQKVASSTNPFLNLKKPAEGSWECPTCMITNKPDSLKCAACSECKPVPKDAPKSESSISTSKPPVTGGESFKKLATTSNPFLNLKKVEEGSWECPTCMITNKPGSLTCAACTEPKPGGEDIPASDSSVADKPAVIGFSFGKPTGLNGSSGFSFKTANPTSTVSSGFSFLPNASSQSSVSSSGFPASSQFSFGNSASFAFGKPVNGVDNSNPVGFSFGTNTQNEAKEPDVKITNLFANQDTNKVMNGLPSEEKSVPVGFSFGADKSLAPPSSNIFNSIPFSDKPTVNGMSAATVNGTPQLSISSDAKPSLLFKSNESKPTEPPAKFSFNPGSMSTPNFNFGTVSSASAIFGNPNPGGQFSFANNNNNAGSNEPTKVNLFASPAPTSNLFTIGGGSSDSGPPGAANERRKIKRAHRRLPKK